MMEQEKIIPYHIIISLFINFIAQIHIIKCNGKRFVKPSCLFKNRLLHKQTRPRYPQHIMHATVLSKIMILRIMCKLQLMSRSHPEIRNSGMLDDVGIRV